MWIVLKIFFSSLWAVAGVICIISIPYIIRRNRKIFSSTLLSIMKDGTPLEEGLKVHYVDAPFTIKHVFRNIHKALCKGNPLWKSMMKHRFFLGKTAIRIPKSDSPSRKPDDHIGDVSKILGPAARLDSILFLPQPTFSGQSLRDPILALRWTTRLEFCAANCVSGIALYPPAAWL